GLRAPPGTQGPLLTGPGRPSCHGAVGAPLTMTLRVQLRARGNQLIVYSGRSILVTDLDGCARGDGTQGFYYNNTRLLSRLEFLVDNRPLVPASVSPVGADRLLAYYEAAESAQVPAHNLYVETRAIVGDGLRLEYAITNFAR